MFPDPAELDERWFDSEGLAVVAALPLSLENLRAGYRLGYFPWIMDGPRALWFSLARRGVLAFEDLHLPRSLQKFLRTCPYRVTFDQAFAQVIWACAKAKRAQRGTWITPGFVRAYTRWHDAGEAHSVEVWDGEELVGGLYGVHVSGVFSGESMFHLKSEASKVALLALIERLRSAGLTWMDTQQVTAFPAQIGAREVPVAEYTRLLRHAQARALPWI